MSPPFILVCIGLLIIVCAFGFAFLIGNNPKRGPEDSGWASSTLI